MKKYIFVLLLFAGHFSYSQKLTEIKIVSLNNTEVKTTISEEKNRKKRTLNSFRSLTIVDSLGKEHKILPHRIQGYYKDKIYYKSLRIHTTPGKEPIHLFAKVITEGQVALYFTPVIDEDQIDIYFFKKKNEKDFHIYRNHEILDLGEGPYKLYIFNEEQVFHHYFSQYFSDCKIIERSLKIGFYKLIHFEIIFIDYNSKCFE